MHIKNVSAFQSDSVSQPPLLFAMRMQPGLHAFSPLLLLFHPLCLYRSMKLVCQVTLCCSFSSHHTAATVLQHWRDIKYAASTSQQSLGTLRYLVTVKSARVVRSSLPGFTWGEISLQFCSVKTVLNLLKTFASTLFTEKPEWSLFWGNLDKYCCHLSRTDRVL